MSWNWYLGSRNFIAVLAIGIPTHRLKMDKSFCKLLSLQMLGSARQLTTRLGIRMHCPSNDRAADSRGFERALFDRNTIAPVIDFMPRPMSFLSPEYLPQFLVDCEDAKGSDSKLHCPVLDCRSNGLQNRAAGSGKGGNVK